MDNRKALQAIFYVLRTGCQWNALPRSLGASSTVHDRFQEWEKAGLFESLFREGMIEYDKKKLELSWQSVDGAITKAPLGGGATGANPVDRGKRGNKRSILTEAKGIPLAIVVAGANVHDSKLLEETFEAVPIDLPEPTEEEKQHLSLDKGYDYSFIRELVEAWAYTPHIRSRGEEKKEKQDNPDYKARRWVVAAAAETVNGTVSKLKK